MRLLKSLRSSYRAWTKPKIVRNGGVALHIVAEIHPDIVHRIYKDIYEDQEIDLLRRTLRKDDVVLDIGSGLGQTAIFAAKYTGRRVYAVEANESLLPLISQNALLNECDLETIHGAAGTRDETTVFYIENKFFASSLSPSQTARQVTVPALGIRTLLQRYKPTYLNIDVEGAEYDLLPLVTKNDVRCISVEVHDKSRNDSLKEAMRTNGFACLEVNRALFHFC
jgi:FkbM family methyltransferase